LFVFHGVSARKLRIRWSIGGRLAETGWQRSKLLQDNPTLMRLRELEVLEKVAAANKLNIVLGEKGLADRVVNLL
jgi:hypothetical protein